MWSFCEILIIITILIILVIIILLIIIHIKLLLPLLLLLLLLLLIESHICPDPVWKPVNQHPCGRHTCSRGGGGVCVYSSVCIAIVVYSALYVYMFLVMYAHVYVDSRTVTDHIYSYTSCQAIPLHVLPVSVKHALLLCKHFPCNPAAGTAVQPLMWRFEGQSSHLSASPEECSFHRHRYHAISCNLMT